MVASNGVADSDKKEQALATQKGEKLQQYLCTTLVSVGAVIIGSSLGWTSPAMKYLIERTNQNPPFLIEAHEANWVAALLPLGSLFGAIPGGTFADLFGRRTTLIVFCVPGIAGWLLKSYSTGKAQLFVARFITGFVTGIFASIIPTYVIEIAEVSIRGALGSFFEISINLGIFLTYILGYFDSYNVLSNGNAVLCALFLLCLLFIPESPTYLARKNNLKMAEKSLRRLRGSRYNVQNELIELRSHLVEEMRQKFSFAVLRRPVNIRSFILGFSLVAMQQLAGIILVVSFAESIFIMANVPSPTEYTIILGGVQFVFAIVATFLVDHVGRKVLLVVSSFGITAAMASLGYYFWTMANSPSNSLGWLPVASLNLFMMMYGIGIGPVVWLMLGEILGPDIKKFAFGFLAGLNLFMASVVAYCFRPLIALITISGTFWLNASFCVFIAFYVIFYVPETKNKTLRQIQDEIAGKSRTTDNYTGERL